MREYVYEVFIAQFVVPVILSGGVRLSDFAFVQTQPSANQPGVFCICGCGGMADAAALKAVGKP